MKIRIFSDIHVDINQKFPFSFKEGEKDTFTLIAGDVSGNPKLTAKWIKANITNGMFIVGNHDPAYNKLGWTIGKQKKYLAQKFPADAPVTFLDESVGVMAKEISDTNILVVGSTLYTDYKYANEFMLKSLKDSNERNKKYGDGKELNVEEANMRMAVHGLNDFYWGHVEDESDDNGLKQRPIRPEDYKNWFEATFKKMECIVEANPNKDIIVMTHHCPSPRCISDRYVKNSMNASYVSDLESFILNHPNIKVWVCGHVHSQTITKIGDDGQWLVCNPRGYEKEMESDTWNPNTFIDTDTWEINTMPYESKKLSAAREKFKNDFMKYAPLIFC